MVTRTLINDGDALVDPGGDPIADAVYTFRLVDEVKRQPIALFDAAEGGGEHIRGDVLTATTNEVGLFTIDLWPNDRGEVATLYKVTLTGVVKPFYIRVTSGEGSLTLLAAKTAQEALQPQTLSLFDALLAQILETVAAIGSEATTEDAGLMSPTDKVKLDGLGEGATTNIAPAGVTGAAVCVLTYAKAGNLVTVNIAAIQGTSNSTDLTLTALPASIRPSETRIFRAWVLDNNVTKDGYISLSSDGVLSFFTSVLGAGFMNSGLKGSAGITITYPL
jgi:hypothetical protein